MRKAVIIVAIATLVLAFAYPAFSRGHGWGRGQGHRMGFWDRDDACDNRPGRGYGFMTGEDREELDQKRPDYELEAGRIAPDSRSGRGYGRGYGSGMWGAGSGAAYGSGACWR